jgi:Zn-dependent protease with chaperone function
MTWHGSLLQVVGNALFDSPFNQLWPILVLPALAALASDRTGRLLPEGRHAALWAAILTIAPGLVALGVIVPAVEFGQVLTWRGIVTRRITPLAALALATWPIARAAARQWEVARLFQAASAPGERLRRAAERFGVPARELATDDKECFVAGLARPTVFVSRGALAQLGDAELDAALAHERAHVEGRDTLWLMALSYFRDLAPFGRGEALEAFRAAREARADRQAADAAGRLNLASALVALARRGSAPAAALPLVRESALRARMRALLEGEASPAGAGARSWARLAAGIGLNLLLVAWPVVQWQLMMMFCESA